MANVKLANPSNVPGALFVDTTCIDCGTCFHLGPDIFFEENNSSIVKHQPQSIEDWSQAKASILSCPTHSIGVKNAPEEFKIASENLPLKISDDVFYCGYTARSSFGATSYLIKHPLGNVLVDSPRFHPQLVKNLELLGGVKWMYLSHKDDIADHEQFARHFKCQRVIHRLEIENSTQKCEMILEGEGDWDLAEDLKIIFTPGHTRGHLCLLYKNEYLFTGDHLFFDAFEDKIYGSKTVNWFSWDQQVQSIHKLLNYTFSWIMPGHGGWVKRDPVIIKNQLSNLK